MFSVFKKNGNSEEAGNNGALGKSEHMMRGGTNRSYDENAPKEVASEDMVVFDVSSSFSTLILPGKFDIQEKLNYFAAFAVKAGDNTFIFLQTEKGAFSRGKRKSAWALIEDDIFPELVGLTRKYQFAASNGRSSYTNGLPENFGGSVNIKFADGEKIYFANNQTPIISYDAAVEIVNLFRNALEGRKVNLPDLSGLVQIDFAEERKNCGFTKATLTINPDGTGMNEKIQRFEDPKIFESQKEVDAETIKAIKDNIANNGMLAWELLPDNGYELGGEKEMTFIFESGEEICVKNDRLLPMQVQGGFFNIELEMTIKH